MTRIAKLPYTDLQIALSSIGTNRRHADWIALPGASRSADCRDASAIVQCIRKQRRLDGRFAGCCWRAAHTCVLLPLAMLGGFGLPVLMDLFDAARQALYQTTRSPSSNSPR